MFKFLKNRKVVSLSVFLFFVFMVLIVLHFFVKPKNIFEGAQNNKKNKGSSMITTSPSSPLIPVYSDAIMKNSKTFHANNASSDIYTLGVKPKGALGSSGNLYLYGNHASYSGSINDSINKCNNGIYNKFDSNNNYIGSYVCDSNGNVFPNLHTNKNKPTYSQCPDPTNTLVYGSEGQICADPNSG